jgi:glycerophosphoryl diester phosphodiesterase
VLDWAARTNALLNIELKSEQPLLDRVAQVVARSLSSYRGAPEFALVSSFHPTLVRQFAKVRPDVATALLVDKNHPCLVNAPWLKACKSNAVHPHAELLLKRPELLQRVPGALINTWTVNDEQQAIALAQLGVSGLISDRPGAILAALGR